MNLTLNCPVCGEQLALNQRTGADSDRLLTAVVHCTGCGTAQNLRVTLEPVQKGEKSKKHKGKKVA